MVKIRLSNLLLAELCRACSLLLVEDEALAALGNCVRVIHVSQILKVVAVLRKAHAEKARALDWRYRDHLVIDHHSSSLVMLCCRSLAICFTHVELHRVGDHLLHEAVRDTIHLRVNLDNSLHELLSFADDFAHMLVSLLECGDQLTIELLILHNAGVPAPANLALKGFFLSL